jgi:hypothetical protein
MGAENLTHGFFLGRKMTESCHISRGKSLKLLDLDYGF